MEAIEKSIENYQNLNSPNSNHIIFNNKEFCKYMGICSKTAQKWRDQRLITYTKVGREIYYTMTNILLMLENHEYKSFGEMNKAA